MMELELPWPPSNNTYWRRNANRYFISAKGIAYRTIVQIRAHKWVNCFDEDKKIFMKFDAYPPDNRIRDLDNLFKSVFDSLQFAKVYVNDTQIKRLLAEMKEELVPNGKIIVSLTEI